jgi:hypothetical protein
MTIESVSLPAARRRWFQFRLRTLFVLTTLVALWLAWELSFIRERQAWLRENPALVPDNPLDPALVAVNDPRRGRRPGDGRSGPCDDG